jgi:hypothetical protein
MKLLRNKPQGKDLTLPLERTLCFFVGSFTVLSVAVLQHVRWNGRVINELKGI